MLHPAVPAASVAELIALAKARPGEPTYASPGNGTAMHLTDEYFKTLTGVEMVHVPYRRDGAPALADEKVAAW